MNATTKAGSTITSGKTVGSERLNEFVEGLVRVGTPALVVALGVPEDAAERAMRGVVDAVCTEFARTTIYIPIAFDARNRDLFRKYHQESRRAAACSVQRVHELASEYAMTWRQVYSVLKTVRDAGGVPGVSCVDAT